jgi:sortase A
VSDRPRGVRVFGAALLAAALLSTCSTGARHTGREADAPYVAAPAVTAANTESTATTVALPRPQHAPADAYADVPVRQIGTIRIPAIGLVHPIYEGIWLTVIDHGPGHWPGSAMPGKLGNAVFAGHRVTHSHPFLDLDRLRPGDAIIFDMPNGHFTYRVTRTLIVTPDQSYVVDQQRSFDATLIACHPKHSAVQRIVVQAHLA